ncbi:hypothetical protein BD779DRAFT_1471281 [Infundibulicybe gibba]|nr:hypothetical protein BD779DRAFT_1471281 [Infundibulicybe gibba]
MGEGVGRAQALVLFLNSRARFNHAGQFKGCRCTCTCVPRPEKKRPGLTKNETPHIWRAARRVGGAVPNRVLTTGNLNLTQSLPTLSFTSTQTMQDPVSSTSIRPRNYRFFPSERGRHGNRKSDRITEIRVFEASNIVLGISFDNLDDRNEVGNGRGSSVKCTTPRDACCIDGRGWLFACTCGGWVPWWDKMCECGVSLVIQGSNFTSFETTIKVQDLSPRASDLHTSPRYLSHPLPGQAPDLASPPHWL